VLAVGRDLFSAYHLVCTCALFCGWCCRRRAGSPGETSSTYYTILCLFISSGAMPFLMCSSYGALAGVARCRATRCSRTVLLLTWTLCAAPYGCLLSRTSCFHLPFLLLPKYCCLCFACWNSLWTLLHWYLRLLLILLPSLDRFINLAQPHSGQRGSVSPLYKPDSKKRCCVVSFVSSLRLRCTGSVWCYTTRGIHLLFCRALLPTT